MTLSYPLTINTFFGPLPISEMSLDCPSKDTVAINYTAGGKVLSAEVAPRLWRGAIQLGRLMRHEAMPILPLLDALRLPGRNFMIYDKTKPFPLHDPTGSVIDGSSPTIASVNSDNRQIAVAGLPAGYVLARGDYVSILYTPTGEATAVYGFHRILESSVTANGSGVTDEFEITPHLRPGAAEDDVVGFSLARFTAKILPRSLNMGVTRRGITEGIGFEFVQVI